MPSLAYSENFLSTYKYVFIFIYIDESFMFIIIYTIWNKTIEIGLENCSNYGFQLNTLAIHFYKKFFFSVTLLGHAPLHYNKSDCIYWEFSKKCLICKQLCIFLNWIWQKVDSQKYVNVSIIWFCRSTKYCIFLHNDRG